MFDRKSLALLALSAAAADAFTASPSALPTRSTAGSSCSATPSLALRMSRDEEGAPSMDLSRRAVFNAGAASAAAWLFSSVPALASDWMEVEDPKTGKNYYYNTVTQKTSWTNPEGAAAAPAGETTKVATGGVQGESTDPKTKASRMGGLLEPFKDINKGFQLLKPRGWNQFDAAPGEYDIKWEDLVEKSEMVMVGTKEVQTAKSVDALGDVEALGKKLAAKKKAELVSAEKREVDGILFYKFIFKQGNEKVGAREVYQLCVNKGRLWSVTATTSEKRWAKREKFYDNVMMSFVPKL